MIGKTQIKKCFTQAQPFYEQQALAQREIIRQLTALLTGHQRNFHHCLEIGCGSGQLTRELAQQVSIQRWDLNDLCEQHRAISQILPDQSFRFIQGDAEQLCLPRQYDLIATASTVQWFENKPQFLARCAAHLLPRGLLLFSTFAPENLSEIKQLTQVGLDYPTVMQWQQWLSDDFEILHLSSDKIVLEFDSPKAVLLHLKQTGVTATHQTIWTKKKLQDFYQNYEKNYRTSSGKVRLTYAPILGLAKRK
ncbi:malonyl-ACP O-methyltransferase BioC [Actinobacillus porcinus]|uniref:malonyl-ACP O-methyltransferase BioC n=1 Tax=Actinobacillus porcinus TaxID=51048 RepID=UPI002354BEB2|nr:malonyl-ACP O-methyltransferase BioC [Actinobacillus porcinus]